MKKGKRIICFILIFSIIMSIFSNPAFAAATDTMGKLSYKSTYNIGNKRYNVYVKYLSDNSLLNTVYYDVSEKKVVTDPGIIDKLKIISFVNMKAAGGNDYLIKSTSNSFIDYCDNGSEITFQYISSMTLADQAGLFAGSVLTGMKYANYVKALQKRWTKMDKGQQMQNLAAISELLMCTFISSSFTSSQNYFKRIEEAYAKSEEGIYNYDEAYSIYTDLIKGNDLFNSAYMFEYNYLYDKLPKNTFQAFEKVGAKIVESGIEGAASVLPSTVDIEILNDMGTYKDLYNFITSLINKKEKLDMFLTLLSYVGSVDDRSNVSGVGSVGDYGKIEVAVLFSAALQAMKDSGKYDVKLIKELSSDLSAITKYFSIILTTIPPLVDYFTTAVEDNIRYSNDNYDLYKLHSITNSSGEKVFDGTELLLAYHSDWSNLYYTSTLYTNWDWKNVIHKYIWAEQWGDDGEILTLTDDGLLIQADHYSGSYKEQLEQEGRLFLNDYQIVVQTDVKSVAIDEVSNLVKIYKNDGTLLRFGDDGIISNDMKQVMGNMVLKTDGSLWDTGEYYDEDIIYSFQESNIPYKKIMSSVKQICLNSNDRLVLKNDSSLWIWEYKNRSTGKLLNGTPKKILSGIASVYADRYPWYAVDKKGTLWEININNDNKKYEVKKVTDKVKSILTGSSEILVIKKDSSLYSINNSKLNKIMDNISYATAKDGTVMVIKKDNTLWAWGDNTTGLVGDGTMIYRTKPKKILTNASSVVLRENLAMVIKKDNTLWAWVIIKMDL